MTSRFFRGVPAGSRRVLLAPLILLGPFNADVITCTFVFTGARSAPFRKILSRGVYGSTDGSATATRAGALRLRGVWRPPPSTWHRVLGGPDPHPQHLHMVSDGAPPPEAICAASFEGHQLDSRPLLLLWASLDRYHPYAHDPRPNHVIPHTWCAPTHRIKAKSRRDLMQVVLSVVCCCQIGR